MGGLGASFSARSSGGGENFLADQRQFGMIPRSIEHLFEGLARVEEQNQIGYTVYCSFL